VSDLHVVEIGEKSIKFYSLCLPDDNCISVRAVKNTNAHA